MAKSKLGNGKLTDLEGQEIAGLAVSFFAPADVLASCDVARVNNVNDVDDVNVDVEVFVDLFTPAAFAFPAFPTFTGKIRVVDTTPRCPIALSETRFAFPTAIDSVTYLLSNPARCPTAKALESDLRHEL